MFGYIVPEKPEMKIKEYELFRAYYCGVCKSIGRRYGQLKRFLLSYDSAFLAVMLSSLADESIELPRERCAAHPLKKKHVVRRSRVVDYASDINVLLAYYNLKDDQEDGGGFVPSAARALLERAYRRIKRKYPDKCRIIEERLSELSRLEKEQCKSMDMAAEPFAKLMEEVTANSPLGLDEKVNEILRWLGYNLGKWIYLIDAADDLEKDVDKGNYNPLVLQFKYDGNDIKGFREKIRERLEFNLTYSLNQIAKAYELLGLDKNKGIIENIIYMGMLRKTEQILCIGSCRKIEQSV